MREGKIGRGKRPDHGHDEQQEVRDQHAFETAHGTKDHGDARRIDNALPRLQSEHNATDLDGCQRYARHDHDIEEHAEIESPEATQERGRLAAVANLVELNVRQHVGTTPQAGVDEHG